MAPTLPLRPDPDSVAAIIREAAEVEILPRFRSLQAHEISEKSGPQDLVTVADRAAEAYLAPRLAALVPSALVVGEEAHETNPDLLAGLGDAEAAWVIDPVDGTYNFAHGVDRFAVIIAFCRRGETAAGWIYSPITGEMTMAEKGAGAWLDGTRLRLTEAKPLEAMTGALGPRLAERLNGRRAAGEGGIPRKFIRHKCSGLEYMDLVRGRLDFARFGGRLKPWDHAAGVLMHAEAGGFSAMTSDGTAYPPARPRAGDVLLLAPDRDCWEALRALTEG